MIPFEQINRAALSQYPALLRGWLPSGELRGREFVCGDLRGSKGESLSVNIASGAWADFASGDKGGDPVSLFKAVFRCPDQGAAALQLGAKLGVHLNGDTAAPVVAAVVGRKEPDWRPMVPPPADAPAPSLSGYDVVYTYCDATGATLFYVRRREATAERRKVFNPLTFGTLDGKRGWHSKHPDAPRPLYGLDRIDGRPVLICEGEKAADAAHAMLRGYACISWAAGSNAVALADWSPLHGADVVLWPDNDPAGHKAARHVADLLHGVAASIGILRVDDLPDKADAADVTLDWAAIGARIVSDEPEPPPEEDDPGLWENIEVPGADQPPIPPRRQRDLPPIQVIDGEIDTLADRGEGALRESGLPVFQRGRAMVRPVRQEVPTSRGGVTLAPSLAELNASGLVYLLNQAVEWQRFLPKVKVWRPTNPTKQIAEIILSRVGSWTVPSVAGVITTPTLRPDGSLLHQPGYDPQTRLYHVADRTLKLSDAVHRPTKADAAAALELLQGLLTNFPFVSDVDRAVALSALLTGVTRGALSVAPMHAFRAFAAGSGKSYLADLMSYIATGRACPVMAIANKEDETEKRLVGLLVAGFPIISIDNVNGELGGDLLCQAVERPLIRVRVLGKSDIVEIESRATIIATGNGFRVKGDMTRRTLICTLDAKMERPELRTFDFDPVESVLIDRGKYVSACLIIVRAYMLAEPIKLTPIASFEEWSARVRGALVWLGCSDPVASMETARDDDPELSELRELAGLWREAIGIDEKVTISAMLVIAEGRKQDDYGNQTGFIAPELRDAIHRIAGEKNGINTRRLGKWLSRNLGKIVDAMRFEQAGTDRNGVMRWVLRTI